MPRAATYSTQPSFFKAQPGAAGYLRRPGQTAYSPFVLTVLRLEHGRLIDIAALALAFHGGVAGERRA
jgi:hypothetical protein